MCSSKTHKRVCTEFMLIKNFEIEKEKKKTMK